METTTTGHPVKGSLSCQGLPEASAGCPAPLATVLPPSHPPVLQPLPQSSPRSTSRIPSTTGCLGRVTCPLTTLHSATGHRDSSGSPGRWQGSRSPAETEEEKRDRQTLLAPFSPLSLPRPSALAVAGRTGRWGRNSGHPASQPRAGLWSLPGQEARLAFPRQLPAPAGLQRVPGARHRPSLIEVPGSVAGEVG